MAKWVYMFSEGDMTMRNLLGGKGKGNKTGKAYVVSTACTGKQGRLSVSSRDYKQL